MAPAPRNQNYNYATTPFTAPLIATAATAGFCMGGHLVTGADWTSLATIDAVTSRSSGDGHTAADSQDDMTTSAHPLATTQIDDVDMSSTVADTLTASGRDEPARETPVHAKRSRLDDPDPTTDEPMTPTPSPPDAPDRAPADAAGTERTVGAPF